MPSNNTYIIYDRVFWIYFIITFFFVIVGMSIIITSDDPHMLIISILWLLSNVSLMIIVYHASLRWAPNDPNDENALVCVVDYNSRCFDANNRIWLFVNLLFILLLIISVLWAGELGNTDAGPLRTMSGVLILLGGLILCNLSGVRTHMHILSFWIVVGYLIIWFGLTLYTCLTSD